MDKLIRISKEEKEVIREAYPDVCIIRTMKHDSKRHHYFVEEAPRVLRLLSRIRGQEDAHVLRDRKPGKRGVRYQY